MRKEVQPSSLLPMVPWCSVKMPSGGSKKCSQVYSWWLLGVLPGRPPGKVRSESHSKKKLINKHQDINISVLPLSSYGLGTVILYLCLYGSLITFFFLFTSKHTYTHTHTHGTRARMLVLICGMLWRSRCCVSALSFAHWDVK